MVNFQHTIFGDYIPNNWYILLTTGTTTFYNNGEALLNYHIENGICFVNSASKDNSRFPKSLLRDIKTLIKRYKKIVIASELPQISKYMEKQGFRYNTEKQFYIRGI